MEEHLTAYVGSKVGSQRRSPLFTSGPSVTARRHSYSIWPGGTAPGSTRLEQGGAWSDMWGARWGVSGGAAKP
jgi:hypothetical protein